MILRVMSGESMFLPSEFAYLLRIASRTLSTRSSSCTSTRVAEAPGLLTHIFLNIVAWTTCRGMGGTGGDRSLVGVVRAAAVVVVLVVAEDAGCSSAAEVSGRDRDLDLARRDLSPIIEPLRLRIKGIRILSNPIYPTSSWWLIELEMMNSLMKKRAK